MIFYNGELVDYKNGSDKTSVEIRKTIAEFTANNFGEDKKGFCQLRYPNGVRVRNKSGAYEPKKIFFIDLVSHDGMWRWSDRIPRNGKFRYQNGNHFKVEDDYRFFEKDAELVWFLKTHCPQLKSGKIYFEDFEETAKKEADSRIQDIDIKYAIYSNKSPLSKNLGLLRSVADIFGVEGVKKLTKSELKNELFDAIVAGEKQGSKYVNLKKFEEITDNGAKLKAAGIVRKAIHNDEIKYKKTDKAWYSYSEGEYLEPLMQLKSNEVPNKEHIFLGKVVEDKVFRSKVYAELGVSGYDTRAEVAELDYQALLKMCNDEGIVLDGGKQKETLVKKYCDHMDIKS